MKLETLTIISLIIALIGAAAWTPYAIEKFFLQPKIEGRILGLLRSGEMNYPYTEKDGSQKEIKGIGYTINILITILNKNFNVKDFEVYVKYVDDENKYRGTIIRANSAILDFGGNKKILIIPEEKEFLSINVLEKEKVNSYFMRFIMDSSLEDPKKIRTIESIEIAFYNYKNKSKRIILNYEEIDAKEMLSFDDKYWKDVK